MRIGVNIVEAFDFETVNYGTSGGVHSYVGDFGVTDPKIISFSVAEMRLNLAPGIIKGMHEAVDLGSFGYMPTDKERYDRALKAWMLERHGWEIDPVHAVQVAGVVTAMGIAIRSLTKPGDGVMIQTPLYPPFAAAVRDNGRTLLENPLKCDGGIYTMDFDDLREKAKHAKLLMLCSPHNPSGRVWTREELETLGEICLENDLYVFSDEIHFDLDFTGKHLVFPLAGNALSNIIIENDELRKKFEEDQAAYCGFFTSTFGYAAATAAYETGGPWLDALLQLLKKNRQVLKDRLTAMIPGAVFSPLEGTYLQWIDLSCLGLSQEKLMELLKSALIFVNNGEKFGQAGKGHIRFNLACPTKCIEEAMDRLEKVLR